MDREVLVDVSGVSKKFCRSLKQSLWYGLRDIGLEVWGGGQARGDLRPSEFWAVSDVSFQLRRGECLGAIGPNGAGKSTLLKMLNGTIKPDRGRIELRGRVAALIELTAGFNPVLTGLENIYNRAALLGLSPEETARKLDDIVEFAEIEGFLDTPVRNYSSGMKVRLGYAVAAQLEPDVLILDEVLAVGDVGFRAKCFNSIQNILRRAAVIFVSHNMPQVSRICTDILVMERGAPAYYGKNVPEGIDRFYAHFAPEKQAIAVQEDRVAIHRVAVGSGGTTAPPERSVGTVRYGASLEVYAELTLLDPEIRHFSMGVAFVNQELQLVAQCQSSFNGATLANRGDRLQVRLVLPSLELNPGVYALRFDVQTGQMEENLAVWINFHRLQVVGDFHGWAPVQLQGQWQVDALPPEAWPVGEREEQAWR